MLSGSSVLRLSSLSLRCCVISHSASAQAQGPRGRSIHVDADALGERAPVDGRTSQGFDGLAGDWWLPNGKLAALHSFNAVRVPWISSTLNPRPGFPDDVQQAVFQPLEGRRILDVGCGGGILCEPLCRLGASVTGVDDSEPAIAVAEEHSLGDGLEIEYRAVGLDTLAREGLKFDALVASEVIEHVDDQGKFVRELASVVEPGGDLFVTTLNQTMLSKWLGIYAAENLLGIVPAGVHDWEKFLAPGRLVQLLRECGFQTRLVHGLCYNPLSNAWSWSSSTAINYAVHAVKVE